MRTIIIAVVLVALASVAMADGRYYAAEEIRRIKGLRTGQIAATLGHCPYDEVVHRDNMVITG